MSTAHPYSQRSDVVRWFKTGAGLSLVPAGRLPEEMGIDSRMACEVPPAPHEWARWAGSRRGWVVTAKAAARYEAEALNVRGRKLGRGGLLGLIEKQEMEIADLRARVDAMGGGNG